MKKLLILPCIVFLIGCTAEQVSKTLKTVGDSMNTDKLTEGEVISGLKEALVNGTSKGSAQASKLDGFYKNPTLKIPFPPKVKKVETKLRSLGLDKPVDDFVLTMNRGAEKAAGEAKPVFVNAIKSMTVKDAWGILRGDKNSATNYLRKTTTPQLTEKFNPIVKSSLDEVNATKHFSTVVTTYNKIPFIEKVNPNLEEYVTERALVGLFSLIEKEEANIRDNPVARTTDLLKKVFSKQN